MKRSEPSIQVDRSSPVPLYFQVAQHLEQLIESGDLPMGSRLENETDLADRLGLKIEVETRNLEDVAAALRTGKVDRILLDNFSPEMVAEAFALIGGRVETEASGGINLDNILLYAATGVDFVSVGGVIHQARSLDLSLKAIV